MKHVEAELRKHWNDLWISPPDGTCNQPDTPTRWHSLAFFVRERAVEQHRNAHHGSWALQMWRKLPHKAVKFSQTPPAENAKLSMNAPAKIWIMFDLVNGSPYEKQGRAWILMFESRADARAYRKEVLPGFWTEPVLYYQQPTK